MTPDSITEAKIKLIKVDSNNVKEAIKIQNQIFPSEQGGALDIISSLDKDFIKEALGYSYDYRALYYLAMLDDKAIGITGLYCYDNHKEAWLGWFGVLGQYRGKGYGKILLEQSINLAKKDFNTLRLYTSTEDENKTARSLYDKLGFISEDYTAENLGYKIYSKNLHNDTDPALWGNKSLELATEDKPDAQKIKETIDAFLSKIKKKYKIQKPKIKE